MENYHIAVFDLGKTNKKLLIYDSTLKLQHESSTQINTIIENNWENEDAKSIFNWYINQLKAISKSFNIKSISISSHGATLAAVDKSGNLASPVVSYTNEPGDDFHRLFYSTYGNSISLQEQTATAEFKALINMAKAAFFIKENKPEDFNKTSVLLGYPQYFGFLLTGKYGIEKTYLGSHTYLWDYQKDKWSSVSKDMGIDKLFPQKFLKPWDVLGTITSQISESTGLSKDVVVTAGIHDSNAALLPYLISGSENFILNSTGTWCVVMHPEEKVEFKKDELGKTVFYNISAFEKPVKTSIFMGGLEFAEYTDLIKETYGDVEPPDFDQDQYEKIIQEKRWFILPSVVKGAGQFPESEARIVTDGQVMTLAEILSLNTKPLLFENYKNFFFVLNLSLALQTEVALQRAGLKKGMKVFIEGGFRKNKSYKWLLSALFPKSEISLTELKEASALGAAILSKAAIEDLDPMALRDLIEIKSEPVGKVRLEGIESYKAKFLELIEKQ